MSNNSQELAAIAVITARYLRDVTGDQHLSCRLIAGQEIIERGYVNDGNFQFLAVGRIAGGNETNLFEIFPPKPELPGNNDKWELMFYDYFPGNRWEPPSEYIRSVGEYNTIFQLFADLVQRLFQERLADNMPGLYYDVAEILYGPEMAEAS